MIEPCLVPARMFDEVVYCPRLAYLEWVQGEFAHNSDTVDCSKATGFKRRASAQPAVEAVESGETDEMAGTAAEDEPEAPCVPHHTCRARRRTSCSRSEVHLLVVFDSIRVD